MIVFISLDISYHSCLAQALKPKSGWDYIFKDSVFENQLTLKNKQNILISNCSFENISSIEYVIKIDNSQNILIEDCTFENIHDLDNLLSVLFLSNGNYSTGLYI